MSIETTKKIASRVFGCGESRVKIVDAAKAKEALTADDVRELARTGAIKIAKIKGTGRGKAKLAQSRKEAGRGRGQGSRKGTKYSKTSEKTRWLKKIRSQRVVLKGAASNIKPGSFRKVYRMVKGNAFKSKKQLRQYLEEKQLFKQG